MILRTGALPLCMRFYTFIYNLFDRIENEKKMPCNFHGKLAPLLSCFFVFAGSELYSDLQNKGINKKFFVERYKMTNTQIRRKKQKTSFLSLKLFCIEKKLEYF